MLELAPVLARDPHDTIICWTRAMEIFYGFTKEEALGRRSQELLQTQASEPLEEIMGRLRFGREWRGELCRVRRNGTPLVVFSQWTPQLDKNRELTAIIEVNSDISEHKRIEADRDKLAAIIKAFEDTVIRTNLEGTITSWNASAERLFGYRAEEIIGQSITRIIPLELQAEEAAILSRLQRGERVENYETICLTRDRRRIDVSLTIAPVRDAAGHIIGASKSARDISQRRHVEHELEGARAQLAKAKDELEIRVLERTATLRETVDELEAFAYTLTHDLRAQLRAIRSFSELALAGGQGKLDPMILDLLKQVLKAGHRMDRLIEDVLALSRVGRQDITLAPVDVEKLLREVVLDQPELQPPRAEVTIVSPLLPVLGHELSLAQALSNLLGNAVKYVAPNVQPRVRIYTEPRGERVRIWVEDNGIGIPRAAQEQVFEIFHRLHRSEEYEGTGIGLAIVQKAVARMDGAVGVESVVGKGSRFWVQLKSVGTTALPT
jgi:PAS domain S-box-containing protein